MDLAYTLSHQHNFSCAPAPAAAVPAPRANTKRQYDKRYIYTRLIRRRAHSLTHVLFHQRTAAHPTTWRRMKFLLASLPGLFFLSFLFFLSLLTFILDVDFKGPSSLRDLQFNWSCCSETNSSIELEQDSIDLYEQIEKGL
uniref:Uncharacterized protein n=1 Tax=Trichogramma kaykai TaxID=54128 RepID=A0ABD2X535_9HYME